MGNLLWQSYPDTGISGTDPEHRAISQRLVKLQQAAIEPDPASCSEALALMTREIRDHFAHEERLMRESSYPLEARHCLAHQDFLAAMAVIAAGFAAKGLTPDFVRWATAQLPEDMLRHTMAHDVAFALHLNGTDAAATT